MSSTNQTTSDPVEFIFYHYDPSLAAACIFISLFSLSSALHVYQFVKLRAWYFIPFFIGCCLEIVGYAGRALSASESPNWTTGSFTMQTLTLLLGPALLAASIYMVLGRLIGFLEAGSLSPISVKWLTKVFVLGDILSFLAQGAGGAILSRANSAATMRLGENVIIAGLAIQIAFFAVFIVFIGVFHYRIHLLPTNSSASTHVPWKRFLLVLYVTSGLIMIRSVFRVAEYAMGNDGPLLANEVYLYVFDAALMLIVVVMFNVFHPGKIILENKDESSGFSLESQSPKASLARGD